MGYLVIPVARAPRNDRRDKGVDGQDKPGHDGAGRVV